jgi:hypothetical protein
MCTEWSVHYDSILLCLSDLKSDSSCDPLLCNQQLNIPGVAHELLSEIKTLRRPVNERERNGREVWAQL